jgi:hypothetical protein
MKRAMACDYEEQKERPLAGPAWRPIMRSCVTVKRLSWTSTKPSRFIAKVRGVGRGRKYSLSLLPLGLENDADQAKWIAEKFLQDNQLTWTLIQHATLVGDTFVFIAK